jgi:hypothetical protein
MYYLRLQLISPRTTDKTIQGADEREMLKMLKYGHIPQQTSQRRKPLRLQYGTCFFMKLSENAYRFKNYCLEKILTVPGYENIFP